MRYDAERRNEGEIATLQFSWGCGPGRQRSVRIPRVASLTRILPPDCQEWAVSGEMYKDAVFPLWEPIAEEGYASGR